MPCIYHHDFFVSYPNMPRQNILTEFVEEAKASGVVMRAIDKAGVESVSVAPAGASAVAPSTPSASTTP